MATAVWVRVPSLAPSRDNKKDIVPEKPCAARLFGVLRGGFSGFKTVDIKGVFSAFCRLEPSWKPNIAKVKISRQEKSRLLFVFQSQSFFQTVSSFLFSRKGSRIYGVPKQKTPRRIFPGNQAPEPKGPGPSFTSRTPRTASCKARSMFPFAPEAGHGCRFLRFARDP